MSTAISLVLIDTNVHIYATTYTSLSNTHIAGTTESSNNMMLDISIPFNHGFQT